MVDAVQPGVGLFKKQVDTNTNYFYRLLLSVIFLFFLENLAIADDRCQSLQNAYNYSEKQKSFFQ